MGQRTKGKMWCKVCGPVLGVKNTHGIRNTIAWTIPAGFLLFGKVEGYFCPKCGAPVKAAWRMAGESRSTPREAFLALVGAVPPDTADASTAPKTDGNWMVTPDRKWMSFDGGEHYTRYTPPPAP